ncbi:MAG: hypothetical protein H6793_01625 [Candidatus Nomurabacteria bacterium]|nr:MAG: hypothetical protein H6793_01625 [Candidatus Nomurabacteria bacterium]
MDIMKIILLALVKVLILACLGLFIIGVIFKVTFGNQDFIKQSLNNSGLYSTVEKGIKQQIATQVASVSNTTTLNTIISQAIDKSVTSDLIQQNIESTISNAYAWLSGENTNLVISYNVDDAQATFLQEVTDGLRERAKTLPKCSRKIRPTTNDIFTINCIPPGTNIEGEILEAQQQFNQQIATQPQKVDLTKITNNSSSPINRLPNVYKILTLLPLISILLIVLLLIFELLLSRPRYRALRTVGIASILCGVLCLICRFITPIILYERIKHISLNTDVADFSLPVQKIFQDIVSQISSTLLTIGVSLIALGCLCLGFYIFIRKTNTRNELPKNIP